MIRWILPLTLILAFMTGAQAQERRTLSPESPVTLDLDGRTVFDVPGPATGLYVFEVAFATGPVQAALGAWPTKDGKPEGDAPPDVVDHAKEIEGPIVIGPYVLHPETPHRFLVAGRGEATVTLRQLDALDPVAGAPVLKEGVGLLTPVTEKIKGEAALAAPPGEDPIWISIHGEPGRRPELYVRQETEAGRRNSGWFAPLAGPLSLTPDPIAIFVRPDKGGEGRLAYLKLDSNRFGGVDERGDDWESAAALAIGTPATGLLLPRDTDRFRLTVPEDVAALDLEVEAERFFAGYDIRVLKPPFGKKDVVLSTAAKAGRAAARGLHLPAGDYGVAITRTDKTAQPRRYSLLLTPATAAAPGLEREPNQRRTEATPLPADGRIKGTVAPGDPDAFSFDVENPDQLWRLQMTGGKTLALTDARGREMAKLHRPRGARYARAEALDLLPGRYYVTLSAEKTASDYRLRLRSLGAPPADFEREPNDDDAHALRLRAGESRRGLLPWGDPADRYVFEVPGRDRYILTIEAPDDSGLSVQIYRGARRHGEASLAPGERIEFAKELEPESYTIALERAGKAGQGLYRIALALDEGAPAGTDNEPNSWLGDAEPTPPGGRMVGRAGGFGGWDYFRVPVPEEPGWFLHDCPSPQHGAFEQGFASAELLARPALDDPTVYGKWGGLRVYETAPEKGAAWIMVYRENPYDCRLYFDADKPLENPQEFAGPTLFRERAMQTPAAWRLRLTGAITEAQGAEHDPWPLDPPDGATGAVWRCLNETTGEKMPAWPHDGADWIKPGRWGDWRMAQFTKATPRYLMVGGKRAEPGAYSCDVAYTDASWDSSDAPPATENGAELPGAAMAESPDVVSEPAIETLEPVAASGRLRVRIGRHKQRVGVPIALPPGAFYSAGCVLAPGAPAGASFKMGRESGAKSRSYGPRSLAVMPEDGQETLVFEARSDDWSAPVDLVCDLRAGESFAPYPPEAAPPGWSGEIALDQERYAAVSPDAQTLSGALSLRHEGSAPVSLVIAARVTGRGWRIRGLPKTIALEPGAAQTLPFTLALPPFADAGRHARIVIDLNEPGAVTAPYTLRSAILTGEVGAEPVSPGRFREAPLALQGGLNLLDRRLGAALIRENGETVGKGGKGHWIEKLHDHDPAYSSAKHSPSGDLVFQLAGDEAHPLRGAAFSMRLVNKLSRWARDLRLQLSLDGEDWTQVAAFRLEAIHERQFVVFEEPVKARYLRLITDRSIGDTTASYINDIMAIAEPGYVPPSLAPLDVAAPALGGVLVGQSINEAIFESPRAILFEGAEMRARPRKVAKAEEGETPPEPAPRYWITGFANMRAAKIAGFEWVTVEGEASEQPERLNISISRDTVARFDPLQVIERPEEGALTRRVMLDEPVYARFVRFDLADNSAVKMPRVVRVLEAPPAEDYLPVAGLWNEDDPAGPYEWFENPPVPLPSKRGGETVAEATPIDLSTAFASRARYGADGEDWFAFSVDGAEPRRVLMAMDGGDRLRQTALALFDSAGAEIPLKPLDIAEIDAMDPHPEGEPWSDPRPDRLVRAAMLPPGDYRMRVSVPGRLLRVRTENVGAVRNRRPAITRAFRDWADAMTGPFDAVSFPEDSEWEDEDGFVRGRDHLLRALNAGPVEVRAGSSSFTTAMAQEAQAYRDRDGAKQTVGFATGAIFNKANDYDFPDVIAHSPVPFAGMMLPCFAFGCPDTRFAANRMRAAAAATGGRFARISRTSDVERLLAQALAMMSDWRGYRLSVALDVPPPPKTGPGVLLASRAEKDAEDGRAMNDAGGRAPVRAVALVLDASGSMLKRMPPPDGRRRIAVARESLSRVVSEMLEPKTPFVFRAFGLRKDACESQALAPFGPLEREEALDAIRSVPAINLAKTPIAKSLMLAGKDIAGHAGAKSIILVTDGEETCGGDVTAAIKELRKEGVTIRLDIVGFAIDDEALKAQFAAWAKLGGGVYFDAADAQALGAALTEATLPQGFTVTTPEGGAVARGMFDIPLSLPPGAYIVDFDDPSLEPSRIEITPEENTTLEAPS